MNTQETFTDTDPTELARLAAAHIAHATGVESHDLALVLGSGWGEAAGLIGETTAVLTATDVPGFSAPAVVGHVGTLTSIRTPDGKNVLVLGSRTHFYEGKGVRAVVHGVRTAAAAGAISVALDLSRPAREAALVHLAQFGRNVRVLVKKSRIRAVAHGLHRGSSPPWSHPIRSGAAAREGAPWIQL